MNRFFRITGIVAIAYVAACVAVWISDVLAWARFQRQARELQEAKHE